MELIQKQCEFCGAYFKTKRQDKLYCTKTHKQYAYFQRKGKITTTMEHGVCIVCGEDCKSIYMDGEIIFCSTTCLNKFKESSGYRPPQENYLIRHIRGKS